MHNNNSRRTTAATPPPATTGKLIAYAVRDYELNGEAKSWWTAIGTAKANKDGSMTVYLDAMPINPKIVIRKETPRESES